MMPIILRRTKGSPLSIDELDGNFEDIARRLALIEEALRPQEGLAAVQQKDQRVELVGARGTILGAFTLPDTTFHPRGAWRGGEAYSVRDLVTKDNKVYACIAHHTSADFAGDNKNWMVFLTLEGEKK